MVAYPEKQGKSQEDLESIVGLSQMPISEDQASLRYICTTARGKSSGGGPPYLPVNLSSINDSKSIVDISARGF